MSIRSGTLLIAHPAYSRDNTVILIIESAATGIMGVTLNQVTQYDMRELMRQHHIDWQGDRQVYHGGTVNPGSLLMLHSDDWYSSNTILVDSGIGLSSDHLMLEKLDMGNTPSWYRLFLGCEYWDVRELEHDLKSSRPKWLELSYPSQCLIESHADDQWSLAVQELSQDTISNYI